jgi:hypothetical protein
MAHGPEEDGARIESLGALHELTAASPAARSGQVDPVVVADALWSAVHGVAALATGVTLFDEPRALAATDEALELLCAGLWAESPA